MAVRKRNDRRPKAPLHKINKAIHADRVFIVSDDSGLNEMATSDAMQMALDAGLDLVEIAVKDSIPICKIIDYSKFNYQLQKKNAEIRRNQKIVKIKDVQLSVSIDSGDYDTKMRKVREFIADGDKVKFIVKFKGRQILHQDIGKNLLIKVRADMEDIAEIDQDIKSEFKNMSMILTSKKQ